MTLQGRLSKLEKQRQAFDPYSHLSDDELQDAIDTLTAGIEAETGLPIAEYHRQLDRQLADNSLPANLDVTFIRRYLAAERSRIAPEMMHEHSRRAPLAH